MNNQFRLEGKVIKINSKQINIIIRYTYIIPRFPWNK